MNRMKVGYADIPWNPVSGCLEGCRYCYGADQARQLCGDIRLNMADERCVHWGDSKDLFSLNAPFVTRNKRSLNYPFGYAPTLHTYRLDYPATSLKAGVNIAVCNYGELFGPWVPDEWIEMVMKACEAAPQHNYLFLTRYPERYYDRLYTDNMWLGRTVTNVEQAKQLPRRDAEQQDGFKASTYLVIEPLLEPVATALQDVIPYEQWVIIGPETGNGRGKVVPQREWIEEIVGLCATHDVPVWMNPELVDIWCDDLIQQYPDRLRHHNPPASENKLYGRCSFCKVMHRKSEMTALLARIRRGESALALGYGCKECYEIFQEMIASDVPMEGFYSGDSVDGEGVQTDNR